MATIVLEDVAWPNGVGDDGSTWRFCDYQRGTVTVMDRGAGPDLRVLDTPSGEADGMAFDDDDGMWVAQPRSHSLVRFTPDGDVDRTISLAGQQPASVAFGGDAMYVATIASEHDVGSAVTSRGRRHRTASSHRHDLGDRSDRVRRSGAARRRRRNGDRHVEPSLSAQHAVAEVLRTLPRIVQDCDARDDVRVVIITGADPAFCAGLDLKELGSEDRRGGEHGRAAADPRGPLPRISKPIIGAINGAAITGGFELALNCDFLVASDSARFADTHTRVGIQPGWGLTVLLREAVGYPTGA